MHQPVYKDNIPLLIRYLDSCINEMLMNGSYALRASMLSAYADRIWMMHDEIGEALT